MELYGVKKVFMINLYERQPIRYVGINDLFDRLPLAYNGSSSSSFVRLQTWAPIVKKLSAEKMQDLSISPLPIIVITGPSIMLKCIFRFRLLQFVMERSHLPLVILGSLQFLSYSCTKISKDKPLRTIIITRNLNSIWAYDSLLMTLGLYTSIIGFGSCWKSKISAAAPGWEIKPSFFSHLGGDK